MREKELRIALVCFGGVSLAVYMHGISKEILKLIRASSALHAIKNRAERAKASFFDRFDPADSEYDSEAIYFELLRDIGQRVELRVIIDIIAGASAGGINGTMLARAISHDLPMNPLRSLWLENADVTVLLSAQARAKRWSKVFLKPFLWGAGRMGMLDIVKDMEVREKLSLFVRSRWFKPPLDGRTMAALMYDAVTAMGEPRSATASLLPSGQELDLYVTLTDYHGYHQVVQIHDPALIHELEHRHVIRFNYRRRASGEVVSDFDMANAAGLAFAARATSSFPGAFPPARIVEMDELVAACGGTWPMRSAFIARNFAGHLRAGVEPATACLIDGAVLNNRPFHEAISAIHGRPAYRQVDRRLVYIDPDPAPPASPRELKVPSFFATLKGAISDIPRNQPVADELDWVIEFNDEVRRLKTIVDGARPHVSRLVFDVIAASVNAPINPEQLRAWREEVNTRVARDAGFAYEGYARLKLVTVRSFVSNLIARLRDVPHRSPLARLISEVVDAWTIHRGISYDKAHDAALRPETAAGAGLPRWVQFFLAFDVEYRKRRLHFLIEGQNRLYQLLDSALLASLDPAAIDDLKRGFYARLDKLRRYEDPGFYGAETRALVSELFAAEPSARQAPAIRAPARHFVAPHDAEIERLIERLGEEIDLDASTRDIDELLATLEPGRWPAEARREVLVNYLGFPFWDVLTFPLTTTREAGEFHEILVDRISPQDARSLPGFDGPESLKGVGFGHFAAFLSRAYRENDYLLGRLHALDRLIDIVCDSAGADAVDRVDVLMVKKRGFAAILDAEEKHLPNSAQLIAALRNCVGAMGEGAAGGA